MSVSHPGHPYDPREGAKVVEVFRLKAGTSAIIRTLAGTYKGCFTHWKLGRSHYCPGEEDCRNHTIDPVWKGYTPIEVYVQAADLWESYVLEITERLDQDFWGKFNRFQVWEIHRDKKEKKNSQPKVHGGLWQEHDGAGWPPPFDMRSTLRIVYHVREVLLEHDNPQPRRLLLPPSKGLTPKKPRVAEPKADRANIVKMTERLRNSIPEENGQANGKKA